MTEWERTSIQKPLIEQVDIAKLLKQLWGRNATDLSSSGPYLSFLSETCSQALVGRGQHCALRTYGDIVRIARSVKEPFAYQDVVLDIPRPDGNGNRINSADAASVAVRVVGGLLSMMKTGDIRYEFSGHHKLDWSSGTIHDCIRTWLRAPQLADEGIRLERGFNAVNFKRYAGLNIVWTNNLAEHLCLRNNDQEVFIFHHATFLKNHQKWVCDSPSLFGSI